MTAHSQKFDLKVTIPSTPSATRPETDEKQSPVASKGMPSNAELSKMSSTSQSPPGQISMPPLAMGPPGGWLSTKMSRKQEILFNIMVAFLQIIPQSTLTTVFPVSKIIATSFGLSNPAILPWLVAAYATSFGTFILVSGRLGDIFGHKNMVILGFCFLSFWSVVAGLSYEVASYKMATYELFFVARGFQGLGASMMVPNGLALLGRTYAPGTKQKIFSFTLFGLCAPIGAYLGMLFGALFAEYANWAWSFYTLAIVTALLAVAAHIVLLSPPPSPQQLKPVSSKLRDIDWLGAITGVGGLVCVQIALISAPSSGWNTQYIYMLLIIGLLLVGFFVMVEIRVAAQPLLPFKALKADVAFVLGAVACGWGTFGVWTWYLWKYLLGVRHVTPLQAALNVLPIVPVALIASAATAYLMRTTKPAWILFWSLVAFTLGPVFLALDKPTSTYWSYTFVSLLITPWGMDLIMPASTMIMSNFFPPQQQGIAGSLIATTINYSISLGLGLAATVESQTNDHGRAVLEGIQGGWFMGIGLGSLGIVVCLAFVLRTILAGRRQQAVTTPPSQPPAKPHQRERSKTIDSQATLTPSQEKHSRSQSQSSLFSLKEDPYKRDQEYLNLVNGRRSLPESRAGPTELTELESAYRVSGPWESVDLEKPVYTKEFLPHPRTGIAM